MTTVSCTIHNPLYLDPEYRAFLDDGQFESSTEYCAAHPGREEIWYEHAKAGEALIEEKLREITAILDGSRLLDPIDWVQASLWPEDKTWIDRQRLIISRRDRSVNFGCIFFEVERFMLLGWPRFASLLAGVYAELLADRLVRAYQRPAKDELVRRFVSVETQALLAEMRSMTEIAIAK